MDGSSLGPMVRQGVSVVGPAFDATIEKLKVGPRRNASLRLSPRRETLIVTGANVPASPSATFGTESDKAAYAIKVSAPGAPARSTFFYAEKPRYSLFQIGDKANKRSGTGFRSFDTPRREARISPAPT